MRVAIDISQTIFGTGVSSYTKHLVQALIDQDHENQYILFGGSLRRYKELKNLAGTFKGNNILTKIFAYPPVFSDLVWNKLHIMPVEKLIGQIDVLHTSDWTEPPSSAFKVTTVHDLYPLKFPRLVHPTVLEVHKKKLSWVFKETSRIIVPSLSTKKDLLDLGVSENIIRVIPEAPVVSKTTEIDTERAKKKFGINGDYLIAVGATPLKNTKRIIDAFNLTRAGKELKLVIVGRPSNIALKEERNVRILGYVAEGDYAALLTGATALVFASIYEGYGIPILDAFSCGVPVVTSSTSSMPEVAGEAAVLVDPESTDSIAEGILKAIRGRKGLIEKGNDRVKEFSWKKTAKMTLDVYNESI
jgi:glycosyltransferase involved in cell wall biosynthesis